MLPQCAATNTLGIGSVDRWSGPWNVKPVPVIRIFEQFNGQTPKSRDKADDIVMIFRTIQVFKKGS